MNRTKLHVSVNPPFLADLFHQLLDGKPLPQQLLIAFGFLRLLQPYRWVERDGQTRLHEPCSFWPAALRVNAAELVVDGGQTQV